MTARPVYWLTAHVAKHQSVMTGVLPVLAERYGVCPRTQLLAGAILPAQAPHLLREAGLDTWNGYLSKVDATYFSQKAVSALVGYSSTDYELPATEYRELKKLDTPELRILVMDYTDYDSYIPWRATRNTIITEVASVVPAHELVSALWQYQYAHEYQYEQPIQAVPPRLPPHPTPSPPSEDFDAPGTRRRITEYVGQHRITVRRFMMRYFPKHYRRMGPHLEEREYLNRIIDLARRRPGFRTTLEQRLHT